MFPVVVEMALIFTLFIANGLFSMGEIALVSSRRAKLEMLAKEGRMGARTALRLLEMPGQFLSTVQLGITLVGVLSGAVGAASLAVRLEPTIALVPGLEEKASEIAFILIVALVTFFSVVIGELVPKRFALAHPETIASFFAPIFEMLARVSTPLIWVLNQSSELILRSLRIKPNAEPEISEEEVRMMIDRGTTAGIFDRKEKAMVEGVLNLDDQTAEDLMTPRASLIFLNVNEEPERNWRRIAASGHSNFPVFETTRDNIVGIVGVKSLWANLSLTGGVELRHVVTAPLFVPSTMRARKLLEEFRTSGKHQALVVDEFGSVAGMVTLNDILEAIVGQLPEKEQWSKPQARQTGEGVWMIDALLDISYAKETLGIAELPGEEDECFTTLGGFILHQLGHVPKEGESVLAAGYRFEVIDMDGPRIDKIQARREGVL